MINHEIEKTQLRPLLQTDLLQLLEWRNHPEIRRYMLTQHEISLSEHQQWFERISQDPHKHSMIFELNNEAMGFVNFTGLSKGRIADWGFYIAPGAPKGSGQKLGNTALAYAFKQCHFHKVCGQALSFNDRSIRLHKTLGFELEGILRDQHFDGKNYHDLQCFGFLASEWLNAEHK